MLSLFNKCSFVILKFNVYFIDNVDLLFKLITEFYTVISFMVHTISKEFNILSIQLISFKNKVLVLPHVYNLHSQPSVCCLSWLL